MIVWLASYPKSGNTLLRAILASYFFSQDGNCTFDHIYKIGQFPSLNHFNDINIDVKDINQTMGNYIKAQNYLNSKNQSIKFFKTHSAFFNRKSDNARFCNSESTLGSIYIVRDPRNVVTSYAHHLSITVKEAFDRMINEDLFISRTEFNPEIFISSWRLHYLSWKQKNITNLIIKYEDLITNPKKKLLEVFNFFQTLGMKKSLYDNKKLDNVIKTTKFNKMQKLEKEIGFREAVFKYKTTEKISFFNLGPNNDWRKVLDTNLRIKIEKAFSKEMKDLGYL